MSQSIAPLVLKSHDTRGLVLVFVTVAPIIFLHLNSQVLNDGTEQLGELLQHLLHICVLFDTHVQCANKHARSKGPEVRLFATNFQYTVDCGGLIEDVLVSG